MSAAVSGTTVTANVTGPVPASMRVEVHGTTGLLSQETCTAVATCALTFSSTTPGTYTVKAGAFDAAGATLTWSDAAATLTVTGAAVIRYDFESGAQGWLNASSSSTRAYSGTKSLAVNVTSSTVSPQVASPPIGGGKKVTFRLWVPSDAQLASVQPYVMETGTWKWTGAWASGSTLTRGAWNTLGVTVPATSVSLVQLGIELTAQGTWRGTVYLDAVTD
ncbi:MAG: hypothetical protein IPJ65_15455 [Archangiaceae bacterium]|nr:hypothetical protein [Archangiaceae bacterium]